MYKIERTDYGLKLTFSGFIMSDEMKQWLEESKLILQSIEKTFYVFVDMRFLKPLMPEAQVFMIEGQKLYKSSGMLRSVVIVKDKVTKMQFMRLAKETGIYQWERYIDANEIKNWQQIGIYWLLEGVDPDL